MEEDFERLCAFEFGGTKEHVCMPKGKIKFIPLLINETWD
jgi:hypothetical protein